MPSRGSHRQLRISPDQLLTPDDLIMGDYVGKIIRVRWSQKGHRLAPDGKTAECGMPLDLWDTDWQYIRDLFSEPFDPGEWFIIEDTRKGDRCARCKKPQPPGRWDEDPQAIAYDEESEEPVTFIPASPAEMQAHARFLAKVSWVAGELGATPQ